MYNWHFEIRLFHQPEVDRVSVDGFHSAAMIAYQRSLRSIIELEKTHCDIVYFSGSDVEIIIQASSYSAIKEKFRELNANINEFILVSKEKIEE